ncbi:uncharacterized protein EI90DRAFT_6210 [Cantharellus anzutake]|uniref:uncharacterized protein n=1 Tax=Cantharellus anzutake TaxID=1750568 RepID=UPI001904EB39|nr:uncharacterized protein EI90DRAFT_6210 [Cantharellus anzutake]KAF8343800.1 hypothetical protein EI90DRAFT_6210 [Cantharellus anzutake]
MTQSYPAYGVHYFLTAAYESPSEFARVTADVQSTQCLQNLGSYMEHESKASFLVASESFGTSVFLMYSPKITIPFITLPPIVKATAVPLVIVLLIKKNSRPLPLEKIKSISRRSLPPIPRTDTLYSNPMYQIAARHFGVSKTFIDYIRGKDYCIYTAACSTEPSLWPAAPDWTADDPESRRLFKLLTLLDAKRKGWISLETDVVFIHADTWDSTETPMTSSLVTRAAQSETQFFRFGTSLAPLYGEQPHVKAVFPIGGILTFTPRAIFEKCEKVFQLIDQAANNTFWQVYVHAETIGLLNLLVHEPKAPPSCSHALVGILARLKSNSFDKTCLCITSSLPPPNLM